MKRLTLSLFLFICLTLGVSKVWALPDRTGSDTTLWNDCVGTNYTEFTGKYVGEFKDSKKNGQGTFIFASGRVKEGIWKDDKFMYAKKPTPTSNSKIEGYKNFCSEIGFTPGTEKFGECVVEAMKKG